MATLVSPGVSVTVTDESFFVPASAPTVPLIFIATSDEKTYNNLPALGTYEHSIVRTVTSLQQSLSLYGIPNFLQDSSGRQFHGDARNEYGLFAINQFLGIGNYAYVVRANVNLNDDFSDISSMWDDKVQEASVILENSINQLISEYNLANGFVPSDAGYKTTVTHTELVSLIEDSTKYLFDAYSFKNSYDDFMDDHHVAPLNVYSDGYENPPVPPGYDGLTYIAENIDLYTTYPGGDIVPNEFSAQEGSGLLLAAADDFKYTSEFFNKTRLGENDAARRTAIVTALQAEINSNTDIRSEALEYNLVLCPGYYETVDEMVRLVEDIQEEAMVIGDTPVNAVPPGVVPTATSSFSIETWSASTNRVIDTRGHVAYYYPWMLASNLTGINVVVAPSGTALRTYAFNDNVAFQWFAPAGVRRGQVTGISNVVYVDAPLGGPTEATPVQLNNGQRDVLYQYTASGGINPITFFPGRGFLVWGQKTSTGLTASALDRVNVSRLVRYIRRALRKLAFAFVFEPNDQLTRDDLKAAIDNFLGDLVVKRGLYDFATICSEVNNTPDRIDRNELYVDIALKPTKVAEFLYIPIRIVSTGAEI